MKKKTVLAGLFTAAIYGIVIFSMTSCNQGPRSKHQDRDADPKESIDCELIKVEGARGDIKIFTHEGVTYTLFDSYGSGTSPILLNKK
jgi:hypothetical protein